MLESAKATSETVDALRIGAAAMKAMQTETYIALFMFKKIVILFLIFCSIFYLHMLVLKPEKDY
jgi:hypothetical protein